MTMTLRIEQSDVLLTTEEVKIKKPFRMKKKDKNQDGYMAKVRRENRRFDSWLRAMKADFS